MMMKMMFYYKIFTWKTQIPEVSIILQTRNPFPAKIPQTQQPNTQVKKTILDDEVQAKLFQADGEIATLRAQLQQLQDRNRKKFQP